MDKKRLSIYRDMALSKATGANIHKVTNLLGMVMIGLNTIKYLEGEGKSEKDAQQTALELRNDVTEAIKQVKQLTGVSP